MQAKCCVWEQVEPLFVRVVTSIFEFSLHMYALQKFLVVNTLHTQVASCEDFHDRLVGISVDVI